MMIYQAMMLIAVFGIGMIAGGVADKRNPLVCVSGEQGDQLCTMLVRLDR